MNHVDSQPIWKDTFWKDHPLWKDRLYISDNYFSLKSVKTVTCLKDLLSRKITFLGISHKGWSFQTGFTKLC